MRTYRYVAASIVDGLIRILMALLVGLLIILCVGLMSLWGIV